MRLIRNILYLSIEELAKVGVSANYLKKAKSVGSKSWTFIKDPSDRRKVLIEYDSLRDKYKQMVIDRLCAGKNPYEYFKRQQEETVEEKRDRFLQRLPLMIQIKEGVLDALRSQGCYTDHQSRRRARTVAYLEFMAGTTRKQCVEYGFGSIKAFRVAVMDVMNDDEIEGFNVSNYRKLQAKLSELRVAGWRVVHHGNRGHKHTRKIHKDQLAFLIDRYSSPMKPTFEDVFSLYNEEAEHRGWPRLKSASTVKDNLLKPNVIMQWYALRHGEKQAELQHNLVINRARASFPDAIWGMDGTVLPIIYQNDKGKAVSNLNIYLIADSHSEAILGYSIGPVEGSSEVIRALKNALKFTMHKPLQLQYDNGKANIAQEVQDLEQRMGAVYFPCRPYNSQAKRVENIIGRFQHRVLKWLPSFRGSNITSPSIEFKANPDHLKDLQKSGSLPTLYQALAQVELCVRKWNLEKNEEGLSRIERYKSEHEARRPIEYSDMLQLFLTQRPKPVKYGREGLVIEINKIRRRYIVRDENGSGGDFDFRANHYGEKFDIRLDHDDMSMIFLYQKGILKGIAHEKELFHEAIADQQPGEKAKLDKLIRERDQFMEEQRRKGQEQKAHARDLGIPELGPLHAFKDDYNDFEGSLLLKESGLVIEDKAPENSGQDFEDLIWGS